MIAGHMTHEFWIPLTGIHAEVDVIGGNINITVLCRGYVVIGPTAPSTHEGLLTGHWKRKAEAWVCNYTHLKLSRMITHPCLKINVGLVEWALMSNYIPYKTMSVVTYPSPTPRRSQLEHGDTVWK